MHSNGFITAKLMILMIVNYIKHNSRNEDSLTFLNKMITCCYFYEDLTAVLVPALFISSKYFRAKLYTVLTCLRVICFTIDAFRSDFAMIYKISLQSGYDMPRSF